MNGRIANDSERGVENRPLIAITAAINASAPAAKANVVIVDLLKIFLRGVFAGVLLVACGDASFLRSVRKSRAL